MRSTVVPAIFLTLGLVVVDTAFGDWLTLSPVYTNEYGDAITGDNNTTGDGWYVDTGADNYDMDEYERPTVQTFVDSNGTPVSTEYFGYLDITGAHSGFDENYMYFGIDVFSQNSFTSDGSVSGGFGSGTVYGVRFGELFLRVKGDDSVLQGDTWVTGSNQGFLDYDGDVGAGSINGFETEVITDGVIADGPDMGTPMLYARIIFNADGSARIEFAFDYQEWNQLFPDQQLDPANLQDLVFEANRGLKDETNYLWKENYSESEAGSPYGTATQNIYELDTLTAIKPVPETATLLHLGSGILAGAAFSKRFK